MVAFEHRVCLVVLTVFWFVSCSILIMLFSPSAGWVVLAFVLLILCVIKCLGEQAKLLMIDGAARA